MAQIIIWNSFDTGKDPRAASSHSHGSAVRPLGAHAICSWLVKNGYDAIVIDFCSMLTTQQLIDITQKNIDSTTVAIGISCTFISNWSWVHAAKSVLSSKYPKLEWIYGGNVDRVPVGVKIFRGLSEDSIVKYMDEKTNKKLLRIPYDIQTETGTYHNAKGITKDEVLSIQMGRGCQFKCKFCSYPLIGKKKGTYIRDYKFVEQEFLANYERFGVTRYTITDDTVNESLEKVIALAEIAQRLPFKLEWVGYNRLDLIWSNPETIELLEISGLRGAFFGIESFHPQASKLVGKGWNGKYAKDFLLELKEKWGGRVTWQLGFIVGLGEETLQDVIDTSRWCIENRMFSWCWNGLMIRSSVYEETAHYKSEFDLNHDKYGYRILSNSGWKSDTWTSEQAYITSQNLNIMSETSGVRRLSCFSLSELAPVGYSFDYLMTLPLWEPNFLEEYRKKLDLFMSDYVNYQLNL